MSDKQSIMDVVMICPECGIRVKVGRAVPDIDGDGSLGCPVCYHKWQKEVVLCEPWNIQANAK